MQEYEQAVFISYAWGDEREEIVNQIDKALQNRGIQIVRDKRDLNYKGFISKFMERIGQGNCVIVVISDKYLRSKNCMFELVEIAENKQFSDRIFPVILHDAKIYDAVDRLDYVEHWEKEKEKLNEKMRSLLDQSNLQGIREDLDNYDRFRDEISGLMSTLRDMNTLTTEMHQESNFSSLLDAIEKRIKESPATIADAPTEAVGGLVALGELVQRSPEVRKAVIEFQTDFKVAREQIEQLGDYKDLHDLLHRLQFNCYNGIAYSAAQFPNNDETIDILTDHTLTFEGIVGELKAVASRSSTPKQEVMWIDEAEQMKIDLDNAITSLDENKLKNVIGRLNRLLATHPARINTLLNYAARALRLPALCDALTRVCNDLTALNLDPEKVDAFQSGVDALTKLEKILNDRVDEHDLWQNLEVELRLMETQVDRDLDQFCVDWPDVKQKAEGLYIASEDEWAIALKNDSLALDEAVSYLDPIKTRRGFRNFQRRVANRFYQVDLELKALCGNLGQIGTPLASVLEMIK